MGASLSSSIGAPSSSLSSFLALFTPLGSSPPLSTSIIPFSAKVGALGFVGAAVVGAKIDEGGAPKTDCWSAVFVTSTFAAVGILYVPSSLAIVSDLPLAY